MRKMTLRKCIFAMRIILNGVPLNLTTTEIINKPLSRKLGGFYISTRIAHGLLRTT